MFLIKFALKLSHSTDIFMIYISSMYEVPGIWFQLFKDGELRRLDLSQFKFKKWIINKTWFF